MNTQNWLTLMEYSAKFRVSLSTLRRRIKAGEIEYKFIEGKYLLKNGPPPQVPTPPAAPETIAPPSQASAQAPTMSVVTAKSDSIASADIPPAETDQFWRTTQSLLSEIKKAYSLVLQEKEEQILQLKEEVADLKTLVRVLEDENTRLKNSMPGQDFDLDLGIEA